MGTASSPPAGDTKLRYGQSKVPLPWTEARGTEASHGQRGWHSTPRKSPSRGSVVSRNLRGCSAQGKAVLRLLRSSFCAPFVPFQNQSHKV